jgi:hypothetical protein
VTEVLSVIVPPAAKGVLRRDQESFGRKFEIRAFYHDYELNNTPRVASSRRSSVANTVVSDATTHSMPGAMGASE